MSEQPVYAIHTAALRHLLKTLDEWEPRVNRPRTKDDIGLAVQAWLDYPMGAGIISTAEHAIQSGGTVPVELRGATMVAKSRLDTFHTAAVDLLVRVAESLGIDPTPLFVSAQVARRVYGTDCGDCFTVDPRTVAKAWPDCLGNDISRLEQHEQDTIRESKPLLERLWRKVVADDGTVLAHDDPDTPLSPAKLAERLGIPKSDAKTREALRKRLESWRKANLDGGWIEARDPKPREPRYLYPLGKVWPLIQDLKPSG